MKKLCVCIFSLLLFSCGIMVTHIENIGNYTPMEIAVIHDPHFIFDQGLRINSQILNSDFLKRTLVMNEYYTVETSQISVFTNVPPPGKIGNYTSSVGKRFDFYKDETLLYKFEIVTESFLRINSNGSTSGTSREYIRIINEEHALITEIWPGAMNASIYIDINDELIGNLIITRYRSRSANQSPNTRWRYHTGFAIELNGKEYGILAFYPQPNLYKNNEFPEILDEKTEDKIILYIFMAYKRLFQVDEVFARR